MTQSAMLAVAANDGDMMRGQDEVDRLVRALETHGFEVSAEGPWICSGADNRPCIPVFRMKGAAGDQDRLTELVVAFYESVPLPDHGAHDTRLKIEIEDDDVARELELEFQLTFGGAEVLALMPVEIFDFTEDLGRNIEQRYFAKVGRFADYLEKTAP